MSLLITIAVTIGVAPPAIAFFSSKLAADCIASAGTSDANGGQPANSVPDAQNSHSATTNGQGQDGGGTNWAGGSRAFVKAECLDVSSFDSFPTSTVFAPQADSSSEADLQGGLASVGQRDNGAARCRWTNMDEPADSLRWGSNSPGEGIIEGLFCGAPEDDGTGLGGVVSFRFSPFAQIGMPPPPPPPTAAQVAQIAVGEIVIPAPKIGTGPDRSKLSVNLWTWLWTDDPGALTATAALGGVSVTATASLDSVTWSLGEPAGTGGPYAPGPPVTMTCQGPGTSPPANYDWKAEPPCGHKYAWMSTADRTGGVGRWPITATTNWTVTWQSNTGVSGSGQLNATGNDALEIGEYRIVLVQGAGG